MGTRSFKRTQGEGEAQTLSFWQRLFGRKSVRQERLRREPARAPDPRPVAAAQAPASLGQPLGLPRNPRSFVARKFDSGVVRKALLDAIARADADPPGDLDPVGLWFWRQGLGLKREVVETLDGKGLRPEAHMRAITWMAAVERLDPRKSTYREDLFLWRVKRGEILDKDFQVPPAVARGGQALRKLYQLVRQKTEALPSLAGQARETATVEIEAYSRLMAAIEATADARLLEEGWSRLFNVFARIDPYSYDLTGRHARFDENVRLLLSQIADITARFLEPQEGYTGL